jgi:hypothetical protein
MLTVEEKDNLGKQLLKIFPTGVRNLFNNQAGK